MYTNIVHAYGVFWGCVWGVPWLTVWLLTVLSLCIGMCMHRVFCQLDEALHCTTACSWFTPLFFNNFWSKIKWHVWLIRRGLIKVLKVYLRLFLPQSTSPWVYIFIIKQFELGSQTWDQSDHLALAPALVYPFFVWKSSVLNSNSNGNIFGLLYSSYLYFEWVKIASLCQCFCVFIFLSCAAKNSACHLGISRLLSCRFRGHDMTNKDYALRRGVQWTFSIHSAYLLKNQSQNKKLSGSVWMTIIGLQVPTAFAEHSTLSLKTSA